MRTVLVNPSKASPRFNPFAPAAANPRVLIVTTRKRRTKRRGRRNPLIVPNGANPLIIPAANRGGRRRRRYRANPAAEAFAHGSAKFDLQNVLTQGAYTVGGGAASYMLNKLVIQNLGVSASGEDSNMGIWVRQGARLILAGLSASMLGGGVGLGAAGGMGYALARELDSWWAAQRATTEGSSATSADLEASLNDVLDDIGYGRGY